MASGNKGDIRICDMIVDVLSNNPKGLTVSQIYAFLNRDKIFDPADNSWKGNVRHILSKKKYFLKSGYKESSKRGRFWVFDRKQYNKSRQRQGLPVDSQDIPSILQVNEFVEHTSFNALASPSCNASVYYLHNQEEKGSTILHNNTNYDNVNQSQFYVPAYGSDFNTNYSAMFDPSHHNNFYFATPDFGRISDINVTYAPSYYINT